MTAKRVLSVGQCFPDQSRLSAYLRQRFGVEVITASDEVAALQSLASESIDLVLVNRLFDADGASGIDFIRKVKTESKVPVMLVSNLEDAQRQAVEAGALTGFGKAALGEPATEDVLRAVLVS
jgi:DNA-binding response OmpR family regulator